MKSYLVATLVSAALSLGVMGLTQSRKAAPGQQLTRSAPGKRNVASAMQQARHLMDAYVSAGRSWAGVDEKLFFHPDQALAEIADSRSGAAFFRLDEPFYDGKVAFFSMMYADRNLRYDGGDRTSEHRTGFVIVGYADGVVEKVPYDDVRYHSVRRTLEGELTPIRMQVFPRMPEYKTATSALTPVNKEARILEGRSHLSTAHVAK